MNRESQIVGLAADHQIQGVDRRAKARTVLAAWEWIGIINRVLAVAAGDFFLLLAGDPINERYQTSRIYVRAGGLKDDVLPRSLPVCSLPPRLRALSGLRFLRAGL